MQDLCKSFFFLSLSLIGIFFLAACKNKSTTPVAKNERAAIVVDVIIAEPEPISNIVEANGTIIASEYVELRPEVSGRLTYLNVMNNVIEHL